MKISASALLFLTLAAVLGPPAHASLRHGRYRPGDCCFYYNQRIDCVFMEDYFLTGRECPLPAVVFAVKKGPAICAHPSSLTVKYCMEDLDSERKRKKLLGEDKEH